MMPLIKEEYIQHGLSRLATTPKNKNKNMSKKKNPAPVLACIISGQSRKTSHNYLNDKAKRLGVSSEWLLNNYVSKFVCSQLRAGRALSDLQTTDRKITDQLLTDLVMKNSKSRITNFWFKNGVYETAKPAPKPVQKKVTVEDITVEAKAPKFVPTVEPVKEATFEEALAELQEA
jgi:hypothetical protein